MCKYKILSIVISFLTLVSCSDWLDLKPVDGVVEEDYWVSKEEVHAAVIGCYSSLLNDGLMTKIFVWGELRADMTTASVSSDRKYMDVVRGEISPDNSLVVWNEFYTTINQCNKVLDRASGVQGTDKSFTEALLKQYEAEVTTIRAMMYFYLVRSFKDVPFNLKASDSDRQDYNLPKDDGNMILNKLVEQLNDVMNNLPITYGNNASDKGRITIWAAKALLADIYLWQENYQACIDQCTAIIGSGKFTMIPVAREELEVGSEGVVAGYVYHASEGDANSLFDYLYVQGNSVESIFEFQFPASVNLKDPFYEVFNNGAKTQIGTNDVFLMEEMFPPYEGSDREVFDIRANSFSYKNGYIWKWVGTGRSETLFRERYNPPHWILYRYSEILLMKAEAMTQLAIKNGNDQNQFAEAYDLVGQIRIRANAIETPETLMEPGNINGKALEELILNERGRELAFEGKRWYDVLRHAKRDNYAGSNLQYLTDMAVNSAPADKVASLKTKYNSVDFHYWPIHIGAIEVNPNLIQNEFYQQKK